MSNFSDQEDLGESAVAEGRKEAWSDEEDYESAEDAPAASGSIQTEETSWSDDEPELEPEHPTAGVRTRGADPIGDLRTKASKINTSASRDIDAFFRQASKQAEKARVARRKLDAVLTNAEKKYAAIRKDSKLSESAKMAQLDQKSALIRDVAKFSAELETKESALNELMRKRRLSSGKTTASSAGSGRFEVDKKILVPSGRTSEQVTTRAGIMYLGPGMKMSYHQGGEAKTLTSDGSGHAGLLAGAKYTLQNLKNTAGFYQMMYAP